MKDLYNLEYRVVDKKGRTKATKNVGIFDSLDKIEFAKTEVLNANKKYKIAFDLYLTNNMSLVS
jgi:hypothetical protein